MNKPFDPIVDVAPWVQTYTGKRLDLITPRPDMIDPEDIAVGLSRLSRYSGATFLPVTVAEHSVNVMREVETQGGDMVAQFVALMHDAHEYALGDITTPVQVALYTALAERVGNSTDLRDTFPALFRAAYSALKARLDAAIFTRVGLTDVLVTHRLNPKQILAMRAMVDAADRAVLMAERNHYMATPPASWGEKLEAVTPSVHRPMGLSSEEAHDLFMAHFHRMLGYFGIEVHSYGPGAA